MGAVAPGRQCEPRDVERILRAAVAWASLCLLQFHNGLARETPISYLLMRQASCLTRCGDGLGPRGQTPVIKLSDPHGRISVIAAITISPRRLHFGFYFHLLPDNANFRGDSVARFIEDVHRRIGGPITLAWDSIPIHSAKPVRDFLAAHRRIVVEPFPPYAPEMNPVDSAWGYVKYDRLANYTPRNLDELRKSVTTELRRLQKRPDLLKSFFSRTGLGLGP
jgi:transposase